MMDEGRLERGNGINTNPQSVIGEISVKDMGSRLQKKQMTKEDQQRIDREISRAQKKSVAKKPRSGHTHHTILDSDIERYRYYPTTESNKAVFGQILEWCSQQLDNDLPDDVVRSLADVVLETVKSETLGESDKRTQLASALNHEVKDEDLKKIFELSRQITDYEKEETDSDSMGVVSEDEDVDEEDEDIDEDTDEVEEDGQSGNEITDVTLPSADISNEGMVVLDGETDQHKQEIGIKSIDRYWIARQLGTLLPKIDSYKRTELAKQVFGWLEDLETSKMDLRKFEQSLMELFDHESNGWIRTMLTEHTKVYYGVRLAEADNKDDILKQMKDNHLDALIDEYSGKRKQEDEDETANKRQKTSQASFKSTKAAPRYVDIRNLAFDRGSRLMTVHEFKLPKGSFKRVKGSWEEVHIPAPKSAKADGVPLISISQLPLWAQRAFPVSEMKKLNIIQSKVYPAAFESDENILMCAPTGAGKTNVALLTILRLISQFMDEDNQLRLNDFKIVYVAPLKALVQEQVREFSRRLEYLGIKVSELTGDSNLTKHEIASTQILVTTPEKWDVITRKSNDASYVKLVRLIIIDEIHLLHDERGPVVESIVARTLRETDRLHSLPVRLVGLSATLPNYRDVAEFLHVNPSHGLFHFDASYRPCPLAQQFIGITEKKGLKKYQALNDACYEKVMESLKDGQQVIVFVHSRKETAKTAKAIADKILDDEKMAKYVQFSSGVKEILRSEAEDASSEQLKGVLPFGFGIHHAGMSRKDRSTAEDLFAQGYIKVLVSTATLAWGVNLPAHTVIIKGTTIYSPEEGTWVQLSPQDILQMLGRAGRPRYDTNGEGIIITSQSEVKYYLAVLNQQLPIESQMLSRLCDNINAEIVSDHIHSLKDCIDWLEYTYLYVRMMHDRPLYRVDSGYDDDKKLNRRRRDLGYSALVILARFGLIQYDYDSDTIIPTDLGKVASYFYISYESIATYSKQLTAHLSEVELFRIFSGSEEFKYLSVRDEEKGELRKLMNVAPIPIKEPIDDPLAKTNVLLQAYISRLKLDGFALMADKVYVVQSAGRLFRAMYELSRRKKYASLCRLLLEVCKMVDNRMWLTNSPLRQFPDAPKEIIRTAERSLTPWKEYLALQGEREVTTALKAQRFGNLAHQLLIKFPQVGVQSTVEPITASLVKIELEITPKWKWDVTVHGYSESFTILVEDGDSNNLLYSTSLVVHKRYINEPHLVDFTVPLYDRLQPNLFVSVISDKWLNCECREPIMLNKLSMPKKFPAPTPLLDLPLISTKALGVKEFSKVFVFDHFNKFQSQVFGAIYNDFGNVLCCCSKGNGKTALAELAILAHWKNGGGRAVFLDPVEENVASLYKHWRKKMGKLAGGKLVAKLSGELAGDLDTIAHSHLVLATPSQFLPIIKGWKKRENVQDIGLFVCDNCHLMGDSRNCYEPALTWIRFMSANIKSQPRIVALGSSMASPRDFAEWLGVPKQSIYDFGSRERQYPLQVRFKKFEIPYNPSAIECMIGPSFEAVSNMDEDKGEEKAIVFVSNRRQCVDISAEFIRRLKQEQYSWLRTEEDSISPYISRIRDPTLKQCLKYGIGCYYESMAKKDRNMVERLFEAGALSCLIATKSTCYWCPEANYVIVLGTKEYNGKEHRFLEYTTTDILEMVGLSRKGEAMKVGRAEVFTNTDELDYYQKFIAESLPVESSLTYEIHECLLDGISTGWITDRQKCVDWITYTYLYRRLQLNPSYYGIKSISADGLSEYLSELVEDTLKDLADSKLIELDTEDEDSEIKPLSGCMIASYYGISFITMQMFMEALDRKSRLKKLLEIVSSAHEFDSLPIREGESSILSKLYDALPVKWAAGMNFESPAFKTFILLQAHFSRLSLPPDLKSDVQSILNQVTKVLYASVDILSSKGYLNALNVMDLMQMVVQGLWDSDSCLKQVPFFNDSILAKCKKLNVETIYDIMALEDDERDQLLAGLSDSQVSDVAEFVNNYPNLEVTYKLDLKTPLEVGKPREISIKIERDEEPTTLDVVSSRYHLPKQENWWVVVGEPKTRRLYGIKKMALRNKVENVKMDLVIPESGKHDLDIWCICDSYIDADKQVEVKGVNVD